MLRTSVIAILATLALIPATISVAGAEANSQPRPVIGRWVTTVIVARATSIVTGALPSRGTLAAPASLTGHKLDGIASFYWQEQMTANGERFDKTALTAAHKTLPFNTRVRVTHLGNGRSVIVRINDRGPFKPGRVIDLSDAAAGVLQMKGQGVAPVKVEILR